MKKLLLGAVALLMSLSLFAQEQIYLWPGKTAPGSKKVKVEHEFDERSSDPAVQNRAETGITQPYMTLFKADNPNGAAILIAPGGAYQRVVIDVEGGDIAKKYNEAGITCFVLSYRLPGDEHAEGAYAPLADAQRAIRLIRKDASKYGVDPAKIGVMGFSAGGHLASCLGTKYDEKIGKPVDKTDEISARPDFMLLGYPVITMSDEGSHKGSRQALLGEDMTEDLKKAFSTELFVTPQTPQTFIALSQNDGSVKPYLNAVTFAQKLSENKVPYELHIFQDGKHGFKTNDPKATCKEWQNISINWLKDYIIK